MRASATFHPSRAVAGWMSAVDDNPTVHYLVAPSLVRRLDVWLASQGFLVASEDEPSPTQRPCGWCRDDAADPVTCRCGRLRSSGDCRPKAAVLLGRRAAASAMRPLMPLSVGGLRGVEVPTQVDATRSMGMASISGVGLDALANPNFGCSRSEPAARCSSGQGRPWRGHRR